MRALLSCMTLVEEDILTDIEKMLLNTFLILSIVITCMPNTLSLNCATRVERCPTDENKWMQRSIQFRCTKHEGYVCMRDAYGQLFESCMDSFRIPANSSNCPVIFACLRNKPFLGPISAHFYCPENTKGCPPKNHVEYSVYHLYKYPKCIESNISFHTNATRSIAFNSTTEITIKQVNGNEDKHIDVAALIVGSSVVFIVTAILVIYVLCMKWKNNDVLCMKWKNNGSLSHDIRLGRFDTFVESRQMISNDGPRKDDSLSDDIHLENFDTFGSLHSSSKDFQSLIIEINEAEADRINILPFCGDIQMDRIYVPVTFIDGYENQTLSSKKEFNRRITPDEIFYVKPKKAARFIFMLGDAGYGKTVECQRIAKRWCQALRNGEATKENQTEDEKLEITLRNFEYLFVVKMQDVNNEHVSLIDMIIDYYRRYHLSSSDVANIRKILTGGRTKCLIILDGLDEWNITKEKRNYLIDECIPNCRYIPNCTILISMRSYKFMDVQSVCREGTFDKVIRLHGLDNNGFKNLTRNVLNTFFDIESESHEFKRKYQYIVSNASFGCHGLDSIAKIPLLAVFCILTWSEDVEPGYSLTEFYLAMIEAYIKRSMRKEQFGQNRKNDFHSKVPTKLVGYSYVGRFLCELMELGKLAFDDLSLKMKGLIFREEDLNACIGKDTLEFFLRTGLVGRSKTFGRFHEDNIRISFLHKSIQEFLASLYLICLNNESEIDLFTTKAVCSIENALQLSSFLTFLSGFSPRLGCKVSDLIAKLTSHDKDVQTFREYFQTESCAKVFCLYELQIKCYREVRTRKSIREFVEDERELHFTFSDIILHAHNTDIYTIRESAEILLYHANDIKSLNLICIPDDSKCGITNDELKMFLDTSKSIKSLNIEGYVNGKCRLFNTLSKRMSSLRTLGLLNVAFPDNDLTELLTSVDAKRQIHALGLFYIKTLENLDVDYEYKFPEVRQLSVVGSGYMKKRSVSELKTKMNMQYAVLMHIFKALPNYEQLSTFHVSYSTSEDDRKTLLQVLPLMTRLQNVGYTGSFIYPSRDDSYDNDVVHILLYMKDIRKISLSQIAMRGNSYSESILPLEFVWMQMIEMNQDDWGIFVRWISNIKTLQKIFLYDTNIDASNLETLRREFPSALLVKYESNDW